MRTLYPYRRRIRTLKENKYTLTDDYKPDTNIAISDYGFVATSDKPDLLQRMRFGIIPADSETAQVDFATFNIRSEEILDKPTFEPLIRFRDPASVTSPRHNPWPVQSIL